MNVRRHKSVEFAFRKARKEDLVGILAVEHASFPHPWRPEVFVAELKNTWSTILLAFAVGHEKEGPAGFIIYWIVYDEAHVMNVAVKPRYRRRGLGRTLMEKCIGHARENGVNTVLLEVARSNVSAQRLYEDLGFEVIGVRPKYYPETREDALMMMLKFKPQRNAKR